MTLKRLVAGFGLQTPSDICWEHRVNSPSRLSEVLGDDSVHMVEADIVLSESMNGAIMAHPPEAKGDLTFRRFIDAAAASDKGIKLDFKDPKAVLQCLKYFGGSGFPNPVILNAYILIGPGADNVKFDAELFVSQCIKYYPDGLLSVGWTSKCKQRLVYTRKMVHETVFIYSCFEYFMVNSARVCGVSMGGRCPA